jgi:ABC-2 type transport system ATP-binding protein
MTTVIEFRSLSKKYGRKNVVSNLTLGVPQGSLFALLGPNGAGKTTTIKMLMNILEPSSGESSVFGVQSRRLGPREFASIGYVSENQELPEWMTVGQLLEYCRPLYPTWDQGLCMKLLTQFALDPGQELRSLSRGMKVKAALLASLVYRPRLLVLDEPFSGLDALVRDELIRGVLELSEQSPTTVFVSSHDIDEVERLADWVAIINDGRLQMAEQITSLQGRFRKIEASFAGAVQTPRTMPATWINWETSDHHVGFVTTGYQPDLTEGEVRQVMGNYENLSAHPMSLRDIFVALAKTYRL